MLRDFRAKQVGSGLAMQQWEFGERIELDASPLAQAPLELPA